MTLQILDNDPSVSARLLEKFGTTIPDAILVSANCGFEALKGAFQTGRVVIAYGPDPHSLADARYLDAFGAHNKHYAGYVNFPEGIEHFPSVYKQMDSRLRRKP